jgi:hypothetical protein
VKGRNGSTEEEVGAEPPQSPGVLCRKKRNGYSGAALTYALDEKGIAPVVVVVYIAHRRYPLHKTHIFMHPFYARITTKDLRMLLYISSPTIPHTAIYSITTWFFRGTLLSLQQGRLKDGCPTVGI